VVIISAVKRLTLEIDESVDGKAIGRLLILITSNIREAGIMLASEISSTYLTEDLNC
jgi:hypothetical protein